MTPIQFTVLGIPRPQGSKRHVGNGAMVEMSKRLPEWRDSIVWAARNARDIRPTINGPAFVDAKFYFDRPKSHYRTGKHSNLLRDDAPAAPAVNPDIDKLLRALFDALTIAGIVKDDSRITAVLATKRYVGWFHDGLEAPGVQVEVSAQYA